MFIALPLHVQDARPTRTVAIVNPLLVAANVAAYFLGFSQTWAVGPGTGPLSVVTYAFAHAGLFHLVANMVVLFVVGNALNRRLGNAYYLAAYMTSAVAVGVITRVLSSGYLLGASGAVFAVLAMSWLLLPGAKLTLLYVATFPLTLLLGLFRRPAHWLLWLIRAGRFNIKVLWALPLVPVFELLELCRSGWNWTNAGHLLGLLAGVAFVILLPARISMPVRSLGPKSCM